jgi:hypothetical protein
MNNQSGTRLIPIRNRITNSNQSRLPNNVKLALRSLRRQDNKQSILVSGPVDPRPIVRDIIVTKVVEDTSAQTASFNYTYNYIYKLLDANASGTNVFTDMRVISCSVYGATNDAPVRVLVASDGASFSDVGTAGSMRPSLHIRFPEIVRITWQPTTSTNTVISTVGGFTAGSCIQFTVEVRSNLSGDT